MLVTGAVKSCISMLLLGIKWVVLFKSVEGVEMVSMIGKLEVGRGKTVELDKGGGAVYKEYKKKKNYL